MMTSSHTTATSKPENFGFSIDRLPWITKMLEGYVNRGEIPGFIATIARKGQTIYYEKSGWMNIEDQTPMQDDAIFMIASMTKPVTSVALMMLWEEGHFQLRDPVSRFLPEFADVKVSTTSDASGETGELVVIAASSAWANRLRYEADTLLAAARDAGLTVSACRVRVSSG
jgi:CubicO group peptidase (beta-lactamase class C family)